MLNTEDKIIISKIVDGAIDRFAIIMVKRFDEVDERLDGIDVRLDGIDETLLGLQGQINGVNNRMDSHVLEYVRQDQHKKLEKRVNKLEKLAAV